MKELFHERDLNQVAYYQSILEAAGIPTFVRNENLSASEGVSIPDFFPALCVVNDTDFDQAVEIIRLDVQKSEETSKTDVVCSRCGEVSPKNLGDCWNCGGELL